MRMFDTDVSQQNWKDALIEFGEGIYRDIDATIFAQRGTQVLERPKYSLLKTEAVLFAILDWVSETDPEGKVQQLHNFLEARGFIDSDGNLVRWKTSVFVVNSLE